jgi:multiple sugar transport system permease protein
MTPLDKPRERPLHRIEKAAPERALRTPARPSMAAATSRMPAFLRGLERLFLYAMLILLALVFLVPFIWMVGSSFKTQTEIFQYVTPLSWRTFIPQEFTWTNYLRLLELRPYPITRYLGNSLFVAVSVTVLSLAINTLAAYAFARLDFPGRTLLFGLFLSTVMVPFEVLAIPLYLQVRAMGWVDTYQGLIIPWVASPLGIFLLRQFFLQIPRDLEDAAMIDGCSHFGAFWHVILPNVTPALIAFALIRFQASWDAFLWPLIIAPSPEMRVIQVAIASFVTEAYTAWDLTFAATTLATLPVIIMFIFLQRYYVQGMMMSGIKG